MGISARDLRRSLDALAEIEPAFAAGLKRAGYPEPRSSPPGHATLLRTMVGQQVSIHAARAIWDRLEAATGGCDDPARLLAAADETLRAAGLSRQKIAYARSLAEAVTTGRLDLDDLPADDEAAIASLSAVKGIGRWSAEIYLLFAEGRPDIWPAGDLAVRIETGRLLGLERRPSEKQTRALAEAWRPHRGAAAVFAWHHYKTAVL
ncbi:MAG: DNA-3-methyladenine glycosylase family protein [Sphingomonadaceae bacterium]